MFVELDTELIPTGRKINVANTPFDFAEGVARPYLGVCFETQASPAFLHHEGFPPVILKLHELYEKQTVFSFDIEG